MSDQTFAEFVVRCRREHGLTQRELAERIGWDFAAWSKVENGRKAPPRDTAVLRLLSSRLGLMPTQTMALFDLAEATFTPVCEQCLVLVCDAAEPTVEEWQKKLDAWNAMACHP